MFNKNKAKQAPDGVNNNQNLDKKYFHGEAAVSSVENAGSSFQSPSLIAAGASDKEVAIMSSIYNLLLSLLLIKVPSLLSSSNAIKRVMTWFAVANVVTWIPLIIILYFLGTIPPVWLILIWVVCLLPGLLAEPLRDHWLSGKLSESGMGRYLSTRAVISTVVYIGAIFLMGYFLDKSGVKIFQGYATILLFALGGSIAAFFLYRRISAPKRETASSERVYFTFRDFLKETRRGHMGKFMLYIALVNFGTNLCSAFFAIYMLKDLHFTYVSYILVISAEYIARIISLTFWGRMVDNTGSIRVMGIVSRFIPLIPVLWLFSHNIVYLVAIQLVSGTIWAAFDLSRQTFVYKETPKDLRLHYIVYQRTLITFAVAGGALVGALVFDHVFPVFGSSILGLFLVSGVVRFLIVAGLFPGLHKQIQEDNTLLEEKARPKEAPPRVMPPARPVTGIRWLPHGKRVVFPAENVSTSGAYYHPEEWIKPKVPATATVLPAEKPEFHSALKSDAPMTKSTTARRKKVTPPDSRPSGYYYRPQEWAGYKDGMEKWLVLNS